ncbi:Molybdopterin molybdenumtransferase [Planktothrix tepida]|uniref:Molybdopterin molybdenumtransferase n=1 Tax=Planktothrix tepida PCC 9214 TaxID=671072 RepID=A0A1J1LPT7_9CYAN|nr:gephyrin-like molybdotransferase Glp [Planktothrix tepida]CAD5980043.1 Molybdopterin molybdenumtransferase [Planktothrix tepida]CUR33569.1 Molybdopterin molybdenumtransferase [Planktothrix tepida PCC 9214]
MLPVDQAESILLNLVHPLNGESDQEVVGLLTASGRVLAQPLVSQLDFPHWDNSAMDGYAVRYEDVVNASIDHPQELEIIEEIPAGYAPQCTIQTGQAARIFTGACLPKGADTIVIQEDTERLGNRVKILSTPEPHAFIRYQGSYYKAGEPLLIPGIPLEAPEIAVLAAAQCTHIPVYRRLRVALLSTGDELVTPDEPLKRGQLVDSNQYALATVVANLGAEPISFGIIPDQREVLKNAIAHAIEKADIVLSTGGVSVGDYDYVEEILTELGGTIHIQAVAIKPGKPLTVASFPHCLYFGLPGNPVSALVTFWRFVQPVIKKKSGLLPKFWQPEFVKARSLQNLKGGGKREIYFWGQLQLVKGEYEFQLAPGSQISGNLINLAQTTGLAVLPIGQSEVKAGDFVQVLKVR